MDSVFVVIGIYGNDGDDYDRDMSIHGTERGARRQFWSVYKYHRKDGYRFCGLVDCTEKYKELALELMLENEDGHLIKLEAKEWIVLV